MDDHILGLLKVHIQRGFNLAVRDVRSSDPYLILRMGNQAVYDRDRFSLDDKMGDAEFDVCPFVEAAMMNLGEFPSGTVFRSIQPNRQNCYSEESRITWLDGKVIQTMFLRLRNVECGEVKLQLEWVDINGSG